MSCEQSLPIVIVIHCCTHMYTVLSIVEPLYKRTSKTGISVSPCSNQDTVYYRSYIGHVTYPSNNAPPIQFFNISVPWWGIATTVFKVDLWKFNSVFLDFDVVFTWLPRENLQCYNILCTTLNPNCILGLKRSIFVLALQLCILGLNTVVSYLDHLRENCNTCSTSYNTIRIHPPSLAQCMSTVGRYALGSVHCLPIWLSCGTSFAPRLLADNSPHQFLTRSIHTV
jgi:hypothetical protein